MAYSAELVVKYVHHGKVFSGLLLYIEDLRVAVRAVKPLHVSLMREDSGRDHRPFSLKEKVFLKFYRFSTVPEKIFRLNQSIIQGTDPVYLITKGSLWQVTRTAELLVSILYIAVMASVAVFIGMSESDVSIVTRPAVFAVSVPLFSYLGGIAQHVEFKLQMTYIAGIFQAVTPV